MMNSSKSDSQQALAPAERYETCPMCHTCVVESRLICQACIRAGNFTAPRDGVTFACLQAQHSALSADKASLEALLSEETPPPRHPSLLSRRCECRLRLAQLRRALTATRDAVSSEQARRSEARRANSTLRREADAYRRKLADLEAGLASLKKRSVAERAKAERAVNGAASKARSLCRLVAADVYNLRETERSLVNQRMRLPPLSSFPSRSLEPAPEIYQALLAASSLLQALTACLAAWTPFQPVAITFMRSPLSRDSVNAQHRKLEVAVHSLCSRYLNCAGLFAPGDPLLTLCRLLDSPDLGVDFVPASGLAGLQDKQQLRARRLLPNISYDPIHVRAEWELPSNSFGVYHDASHSSGSLTLPTASPQSRPAGDDVVDAGDEDWVEVDDGFPIPVDESCYENRAAFLTSLWR